MDEKNLDKDLKNEDLFNSSDDDDDEDDIEFDDNINIEALTQQLQQHVDMGDVANMSNEDFNKAPDLPVVQNPAAADTPAAVESFPKLNCKKYVVYINPDNVDYVDNLSIDERTELINSVISERQSLNKKQSVLLDRQRYLKHLMIVCITVILSFPLLFYAVNKSLQATITNYQQSQQNFQKLYKERGKYNSYQKMDIR